MIKANAYGQGLLPAAGTLADMVDGFGVARLREALEIQETGYTGKIVLVEGFFDREELLKTLSASLIPSFITSNNWNYSSK